MEEFDGLDGRKLKYDLPDMQEPDISKYLLMNSLKVICGNPGDINYFNLIVADRERFTMSSWKLIIPSIKHMVTCQDESGDER